MIRFVIFLYSLMVVAHVLLQHFNVQAGKVTELLHKAVDPVLEGTRSLMKRYLPSLLEGKFDWSPVVLVVALWVISLLLGLLRGALNFLI